VNIKITITFTNLAGFIMLFIGMLISFKSLEQSKLLLYVGTTLMAGGKISNTFEKVNKINKEKN